MVGWICEVSLCFDYLRLEDVESGRYVERGIRKLGRTDYRLLLLTVTVIA